MSEGEHLYYSVRQGDVTSESMDVQHIQEKFRRWKKLYPEEETEIVEVRAFRRRDLEDMA